VKVKALLAPNWLPVTSFPAVPPVSVRVNSTPPATPNSTALAENATSEPVKAVKPIF